MASYPHDLPRAAHRTLEAAEMLAHTARVDVAGYLYGLAAEFAVKHMSTQIPSARGDDVFYAHFPELRTLLRDRLQGRRGAMLLRYIEGSAFMNNWHVRMRYSSGREIKAEWVEQWGQQARDVVNAMES